MWYQRIPDSAVFSVLDFDDAILVEIPLPDLKRVLPYLSCRCSIMLSPAGVIWSMPMEHQIANNARFGFESGALVGKLASGEVVPLEVFNPYEDPDDPDPEIDDSFEDDVSSDLWGPPGRVE